MAVCPEKETGGAVRAVRAARKSGGGYVFAEYVKEKREIQIYSRKVLGGKQMNHLNEMNEVVDSLADSLLLLVKALAVITQKVQQLQRYIEQDVEISQTLQSFTPNYPYRQ